MKILNNKIYALITSAVLMAGCSNYLDIVPDNVATIESAFSLRSTAERYLFTCYSWLPSHMNLTSDPAMMGGGELTSLYPQNTISGFRYARGEQNATSPLLNFWSGSGSLYRGIRDCNIFLDNIHKVHDINSQERERWVAEVKFLKAYYHFYLLRLYGPIPLIKESLPISAGILDVRVFRDPIDDCFDYVVQLLDEAIMDLPEMIIDENFEAGRITKPIAMAIKAKVLVTSASPFFNGNLDYQDMIDKRGIALFNTEYNHEKWKYAMDACKEAIDICHKNGIQLYEFEPKAGEEVSESIRYQMNVRNSVCERWNVESIWSDPNNEVNQAGLTPRSWNPDLLNTNTTGRYAPGIAFVELFYTQNGLPIKEDKTWDYDSRYEIKAASSEDRYHIEPAYKTAKLNFNRENRFYASIGFDGGKWYGQGKFKDSDMWTIKGKLGQHTGISIQTNYSPTGYWPKKLINYRNVFTSTTAASHSVVWYPVPVMRLADLYLLYAESVNEYLGPNDEGYNYINKVRMRSGVPSVQDAWSQFAKTPSKYTEKEGLRAIIQQERQIELAFEAQRFYDIRRWKIALDILNEPIMGWSVNQVAETDYYRLNTVFEPHFEKKHLLEPIQFSDVLVNNNLLQNLGW
ncbi:RagB/SusD family nutrient uptake outer membrane protein [Sphingobacterium faecale]|uniref:RagB/SusD family nutrient uptake outer membrane protein n=1 Tax=Sphingobacterium faecale TaxID=2803775 RepID=A0ABS1R417_9SPHI|nr:RagB/SusD family nutrient uptake outer membrane protein [Sphingobacterium faecale]MBL1409460.1 RagB/SusD family nutrient uptake outer membrane protein [Sphingobacterium faecale]